jgi:TonB family protein
MTLLVDIAVRSSVVVLAALAACAFLGRQSAALRHWILTAGLFLAVAVVPFTLLLPGWDVPLLAPLSLPVDSTPSIAPDGNPVVTAPLPGPEAPHAWLIAAAVWGAGFAVALTLLIAGFLRLLLHTRRARPIVDDMWHRLLEEACAGLRVRGPIVLLEADRSDVPAAWGLFKHRVLLPGQARHWNAARARVVLAHELAHIERGDWIIQISANAMRTVFWFNPLFWILCARLSRESEQACDDVVLARGVAAGEYAAHLVDIARSCRRGSPSLAAALSMARRSSLERRIQAMLNTTLDREAPTRRGMVIAVTALLGLTLPTATFRASAQGGPRALVGSVYDTSGGVLPGVTVTLEDAQSTRTQVVTDATGRFEFPWIGDGKYRLETSLPGFKALQHEFTLSDARDWSRAITLQVGSLQETISVRAQRPPLQRPATPLKAPDPLRVGGNIRVPRKLLDMKPVYPESMRDAGLEGLVPIEAVIGIDGRVASVRVLSAQVHPEFAKAAMDAVRQWRFSPTLLNGVAVDVAMVVSVNFSLSD